MKPPYTIEANKAVLDRAKLILKVALKGYCLNKYGISLAFGFSSDSLNLWLVDTEP